MFFPDCFKRLTDLESVDVRGDVATPGWSDSDGNTNFFCLDAGRISSRSTGTPRETRNNLRIRDRIQSGGDSGGGATSWDQRDALLAVGKTGCSLDTGGNSGVSYSSGGNNACRKGSSELLIASESSLSKSGIA